MFRVAHAKDDTRRQIGSAFIVPDPGRAAKVLVQVARDPGATLSWLSARPETGNYALNMFRREPTLRASEPAELRVYDLRAATQPSWPGMDRREPGYGFGLIMAVERI